MIVNSALTYRTTLPPLCGLVLDLYISENINPGGSIGSLVKFTSCTAIRLLEYFPVDYF